MPQSIDLPANLANHYDKTHTTSLYNSQTGLMTKNDKVVIVNTTHTYTTNTYTQRMFQNRSETPQTKHSSIQQHQRYTSQKPPNPAQSWFAKVADQNHRSVNDVRHQSCKLMILKDREEGRNYRP